MKYGIGLLVWVGTGSFCLGLAALLIAGGLEIEKKKD